MTDLMVAAEVMHDLQVGELAGDLGLFPQGPVVLV